VNPFDDPDGAFVVLTNDEGYHSLWPAFVDVPAGWTVVHGETARADCLAYIRRNWTGDVRSRTSDPAVARRAWRPAAPATRRWESTAPGGRPDRGGGHRA
jgi:MbtH protein